MKVEVYGKDLCTYTNASLRAFESMNIPVQYIRLAQNVTGEDIGKRTKTTSKTVPVIVIDGKWIGGFDDLKRIMNESWKRTESKYARAENSY